MEPLLVKTILPHPFILVKIALLNPEKVSQDDSGGQKL